MSSKINHPRIDAIIRKNMRQFRKPGVLTVRPGFKITGGWITDKPAIVVTVDKKRKGLNKTQKLPAAVGDMPVDVREASGMQRLRSKSAADFAIVNAHARGEQKEPQWKFERDVKTGKLMSEIAPVAPPARQLLAAAKAAPAPAAPAKSAPAPAKTSAATVAKATAVKPAKSQLVYKAATQPLKPLTGKMTILAYASPDDGFTVLQDFLSQTQSHLNIALYDFTSGDLLKTVEGVVKPGKVAFKMVLDHPPRNPTANQPDDETRADILKSGNGRAAINWALTRNDPVVTEWIYPTAYHIKVAVRDKNAFWLSSGNFNVSNQPNLKAKDPARGSLKNADRDWHVIIFQQDLAGLFEAYILNDFAIAQGGQDDGDTAVRKTIQKAMKSLKTETNKSSLHSGAFNFNPSAPLGLGQKRLFSDVNATVHPLLTPDPGQHTSMYVDNVLALIQSAQRSVFMQTQYVHPSDKPEDKDFMLLVKALSDAHKKGLDVRLITSEFENTSQWIEKLKEFDLDQVLRVQRGVHNKGIVVDSKVVMISSQNWSADGCLRNRDAGVIIEQPDIAAYFEKIFMDDWVHRANEKIVDASH